RGAEVSAAYSEAGYGLGQRIATLLENRPEYVLHKLALNIIGVCCVPINPDYRPNEIAYLLEHSEPDLVLTLAAREAQMSSALAQSAVRPTMLRLEDFAAGGLAKASRPARSGAAVPETPASILYTSGTT